MKRVLVTAGASGIGRAMATGFDAAGYDVWVADIDEATLADLPPHWTGVRCDASSEADMAALFAAAGMGEEIAMAVASNVDEAMGACILGLYRDAAQPALAELGRSAGALAARPGLMINAENDHYVGTDQQTQAVADLTGAEVAHLAGVGHWWMSEDPAAGAATLEAFWASLA